MRRLLIDPDPDLDVSPVTVTLDSSLDLHPQVALRPEPFGALAYHYGNRRLVFLKHPDVVAVVRSLGDHSRLEDALRANDIAESRWPSFVKALDSLVESDVITVRTVPEPTTTAAA